MTKSQSQPASILKVDKLSVTSADLDTVQVQNIVRAFASYCGKRGIPYGATSRYAIQAAVPIDSGNGIRSCTIQLGARDSRANAYRAEWNPNELGPQGQGELDTLLLSIAGVNVREFVATGKVTRIDIAIDLPDISVDQVIVRGSRSRKHGIYSNQNGIPETVYIGKNHIAVYDKGAQTKDGITRLRVERRLKPMCFGSHLPRIPNPFEKVRGVTTENLRALVPQPADAIFDSMRSRGINRVLKWLPRQDRLRIKAVVDDPANNLLPPDLWNSWPSCLVQSGIVAPTSSVRPEPSEEDAA